MKMPGDPLPVPPTAEKALDLNLDPTIYGTFAEIGAGQEVGNWFFRVGAASGTIAKTMSAYDMVVSDEVYGPCRRYVSQDRLRGMLDHEFAVLVERLDAARGTATRFFAFADTVRARGYRDAGECHGWLGIRFQAEPRSVPQDILLHVRLLDESNLAQQEALGIIGVNLVWGAFRHRGDLAAFTASLLDNLDRARVEVDLLKFEGGEDASFDNRLCALQLVQSGLADAALIDPAGEVLQPADHFHRTPVLLLRGNFDPVTRVNLDMMEAARRRFRNRLEDPSKTVQEVMEVTMRNLLREGDHVDVADFIRRADALQAVGKTVLISRFARFHSLAAYFRRCTDQPIGFVLGTPLLEQIFDEHWYEDLEGGILESFGRLFKVGVRLYVYPCYDTTTGELRAAEEISMAPHLHHLFLHLMQNGFIEPIVACDHEVLRHSSSDVRTMIANRDPRWRDLVPEAIVPIYEEGGHPASAATRAVHDP